MSIIHQREKTHGDYERQARLSQDLKTRIRQEAHTLTHQQLESIEMICVKIARIVCGNPNEADHWLDVQGYAELIHKNLQADSGKSPQQENPDGTLYVCDYCSAVGSHWKCACGHVRRKSPWVVL
jgi:hypothetical protein